MARNFDEDVEDNNYHYDSEMSTPRSEGFDYSAAGGREDSGRSQSGSENGSPDRTMDEAHNEVDGSRESLTDRFKRYIKRILTIGNGRRSPPRAEVRVRKEFRVPLERYGRHSPRDESSSSDNYEFDEQYDNDIGPHRHQHKHLEHHQHHQHHHDHHDQAHQPDEGQFVDYEDEVYEPSPESTGSSLHSGHVHHRYIRSGVARLDNNEPQVADEEEIDEEEELEEDEDGVADNETELTDGPLTPRTRSTSRSGRSSSSSGRSLASSRRSSGRSASRSRSTSRGRSAASRSRSRSRSRSSSNRGSRRSSSASSRRSARNQRQSRTRRRS